jgi:hypothetical protein
MKKILFESKRLAKLSGINENNKELLKEVFGDDEIPELSQDEKAFQTSKKPIPAEFRIATEAETIETKEGPVDANPGDAIMTGVEGEQWPIPAEKFASTYDDLEDGTAAKRDIKVWVKEMPEQFQVKVSWSDALLQGEPGDYLVQYGDNDYGVVGASIFQKSYNQKQENQEVDLQENKMKITRSQLKQLIKEEISRAMSARDALAASHNQNRVRDIKTNKSVTNAVSRPQASGAYGPDEDYHNAYNEWSEHSALLDRFKLETGLDPDDSPDEFFAWIRGQEKESLSYLDTDKRYSGI